ncbi:MAG: aldehyde ferredoxin oxidoreductase family protein [Deltaproteobacteria bacterium]|uniref:Aldehyde ferredoxin oxidoreductase family protein n=1 Tax=Candidatus Zymogenus saltonus TaxID=2844893 RepID=A0A9D8PNS1_9DELT|nr:aldehyde ferredoxin oxidoreductase family protein [Candidatus Zymogenus saltonus]
MPGGYIGRYLVCDLSKKTYETVEPGDAFYKKYLSGYGLGAAVITQRQKPGTDPLSPEAHLGFCSGLLTGTGAMFSGRYMVVGKSPLTGGWGDANSGGFFSHEIKKAGYDAVFFTGSSKEPVWVHLTNDGVEFKSAKHLWGKDTVETEEAIKKDLNDKKVQIASIGMAGEKVSLISGIVNDSGRIAARSGLGSVMGSKKLKAFSVKGTGKIPVADPAAMKKITEKFMKKFKRVGPPDKISVKFLQPFGKLIGRTGLHVPTQPSTVRLMFKKYGTSALTAYSSEVGDSPVKNWGGVGYSDFPLDSKSSKLSEEEVIKYEKKKYHCQACPLGCGGIFDIDFGKFKGTEGHKPEYETLSAFGSLILNDDLESIVEINEMCNRAGIDTISTGGAVAFAIECFENGIIDEKMTGGLKLGWGKSEEIKKLVEMIIERKNIGDLLADGVKKASEEIGGDSYKYAVHAGGQELPMHDGRLDKGYAMAYQCEPTPGRHTISSFLYGQLWGVKKIFPEAKRMIKEAKGKDMKGVNLYAATTFYMQIINGAGVCEFGPLTGPVPVIDYINAATGWKFSPNEYFKIGERILSLRKAFNVREGIKAKDTKMHGRGFGNPPMKKGPHKNVTLDMDALQKGLFEVMSWDDVTGGPTKDKIKELGLDELSL